MDGDCGAICRLQCEISAVSVTGLGCGGAGELFLRCHFPAGGGRAMQIDSRAVGPPDGRAGGAVSWRDVASLSCDGSPACVRELMDRRSVVFEVQLRHAGTGRRAALRRVLGSDLVDRAEVAWRDAAGVAAVERRVALAARGGGRPVQGEAPVLSVRMTVRVSETPAPAGRSTGEALPLGRRRAESTAHREGSNEWSVGEDDVLGVVACAAGDALE